VTLHSAAYDHLTLRRLGAQLDDVIKSVPEAAETTLISSVSRAVRAQLDTAALAARNLSAGELIPALRQANRQAHAGSLPFANREVLIETGRFFRDAADIGQVVVGVDQGTPVYLRDVATILDVAEEPANYVLHGEGGKAGAD